MVLGLGNDAARVALLPSESDWIEELFKTKLKVLAAVSLAAGMAFVGAVPAMAEPIATDSAEVVGARSFFTEFGVDQATQDDLITAYEAGEEWDSFDSSNPTTSVVAESRADGAYTISTFEDGSISVVRIQHATEDLTGGVSTRGITQCQVSGAQYNGCKIDMWVGLVALSFYTSYNLSSNTVTSVPWGGGYSIGGACGASITYLGRPFASRAQMNVQATTCGAPYTTWFELRLDIVGGSANVSWT